MRPTENLLIVIVSVMVVICLPVGAKHLTSPEKLTRHVRAIEPSQQQASSPQQQQPSSSLYGGRSFLDDAMSMSSESSRPSSSRFLSTLPLEKLRYFLPTTTYDNPSRQERLLLPGIVTFGHPRIGRADSNFIRFGRSSFSGASGASIKKNNFIRLGRENPRQNNFIRLGRSGQWESSERFLPKVGFFPDNYYYSSPSHWSRPTDLINLNNLSQGIPTYDDALEAQDSTGLLRQSG